MKLRRFKDDNGDLLVQDAKFYYMVYAAPKKRYRQIFKYCRRRFYKFKHQLYKSAVEYDEKIINKQRLNSIYGSWVR